MTTRTSTRTALRALALAVLVAAGTGALGAPARAATLADAGWWYRLDPAPPPPYVPEDGLFVEGAPEGPLAVAAVRYTVGENETNPVLELEVAGRGEDTAAPPPTVPALPGAPTPPPPESPAEPVLLACPAGAPWTGAHPGPYEEAPAPDCAAGSVNGQVAEDGSTYTFPLGPLQRGTTIDVVLVPGTVDGAPDGANGSTFEVAFEAPTDDSLSTVPGAPPPTDFSPPPTSGGGFDPGGSGTSFDPGAGSAGSFDPGPAPSPPLTDPGATEFQPPGPVETAAPPAPEPDDDDRIDLDTLALVLLGGTVAAGFAVNQRTERPIRSLSRFAPDPPAPAPAVAPGHGVARRGVGRGS